VYLLSLVFTVNTSAVVNWDRGTSTTATQQATRQSQNFVSNTTSTNNPDK